MVLRGVSLFLIVCLVNMIGPFPALAADVAKVLDKLTPQQETEIKNLTPEQKQQIKSFLEEETPKVPEKELSGAERREEKKEAPEPDKGEVSEEKVPAQELSEIERGFLGQASEEGGAVLRQFGYDIFEQAVNNKFALIPSIPIGPDYRINPGDKMLVTLWGNVNETFDLAVDDRGAVAIPKVGVVSLAGWTLDEARDILYGRLARVFIVDFNVDLTIKEVGSIKVYLLGEFKNPGAYTVLANTSVYDAVFAGGGPVKRGALRKIELVRQERRIAEIDLYEFIQTGKKRDDVLLKSGDVIRVPAIGRVAAISGNVRRPGIYELKHEGKTELSDFIGLAGGITPTTYLQRIQIERREENRIVTALDLNFADYLKIKKARPVYLANLDYISVFSIDPVVRNVVYFKGDVARPGRYELEPGMRLKDLMVKAEGLAPEAYLERAQIFRLAKPDMRPQIIAVNLEKLKKGDPGHNPLLQEFDNIRVFSKEEIEGKPRVYISGELNDGDGSYPLADNMRVSDLIFEAGGLKESAYLERAELARSNGEGQIRFYSIELAKVLNGQDRGQDYLLQKNDYLFVRRIPDFGVNETVEIKGEVRYPGTYAIDKGENLCSLVRRAGGYTDNAFVEGAVFVRENMKIKQLESMNRIRKELEARRNRELAQIPAGLPADEAELRHKQIDSVFDFAVEKMAMEIPGRIILELDELGCGDGAGLVLQNGDSILIPDKVNGITVMGEVPFPGTILYKAGKPVNYYLDACGGGTERSDMDKLLVLRASGRVEKKRGGLSVQPGDTIMVPAKPVEMTRYKEPFDWADFWDISLKAATTITQVTTSLVTVYLLYKSMNQ